MKQWVHIDNSERGTANQLSNFIDELEFTKKISLPNLRQTNKLFIFSDYSGSKTQELISYSLLILDEESLNSFVLTQENFSKENKLGASVIEYKKLNNGPKKRALVPFLKICNNLNGLILTIIIRKNIKSIYIDEMPEGLRDQLTVWNKIAVREKFLRLRDFTLLILNGLGRKDQNIVWITDNDEIVANSSQLTVANTIIKETLNMHLDFSIENFELKSLDSDFEDRRFEKLCSLTDLVAGGLVDFVGDYHNAKIFPKNTEIAKPIGHSKQKVNLITNWL
jgi:hypothetical protein